MVANNAAGYTVLTPSKVEMMRLNMLGLLHFLPTLTTCQSRQDSLIIQQFNLHYVWLLYALITDVTNQQFARSAAVKLRPRSFSIASVHVGCYSPIHQQYLWYYNVNFNSFRQKSFSQTTANAPVTLAVSCCIGETSIATMGAFAVPLVVSTTVLPLTKK